jgi:ATP-dependent DNA helicase RecQ
MEEKKYTLELLRKMLGPDANFRQGQWDAIETVAIKKQRALVVQRTGWGKSMVYFLATKLLREKGNGPTLLISPLLSLMRNQLEAAERIGLKALTINSDNDKDWPEINESLQKNNCDLLIISPERLNNREFLQKVLPSISGRIGMLVIDEAHCISDWGHDFRPDYRRIVRIINILPRGVPVLGTTATANNRVVGDIHSQLGQQLLVLRGPLDRESLRLQSIRLPSRAGRLAWLAHNIHKFKGSGIIYCLTQSDTECVANWLNQQGFSAKAYHAGLEGQDERLLLEKAFLNNEISILVATVALGMGFDKPDIGFVIHFQSPSSVITYYQQVGRAGRSLDKAYGILLAGEEDQSIHEYFIRTAFPSPQAYLDVLNALQDNEGLSFGGILDRVNISWGMAEKVLKLLEIDGAIGRENAVYFKTPNPWHYDQNRIEQVLALRKTELNEIGSYVDYQGCSMAFLLRSLNDSQVSNCGRCANCQGRKLSAAVPDCLVSDAERYLDTIPIEIVPKRTAPAGLLPEKNNRIPADFQNMTGRALSKYGETGMGRIVANDKYNNGKFSQELIRASVNMILYHWRPDPMPEWVCCIPSTRHPLLVPELAKAIADSLGIPFVPLFRKTTPSPEQKGMLNHSKQAKNVFQSLGIAGNVYQQPVLLIDDIIDSGWTLTIAGYLLRKAGSGFVYPFVLAKATGRTIG